MGNKGEIETEYYWSFDPFKRLVPTMRNKGQMETER